MRNFRHLPPRLPVASNFERVFFLAGIALLDVAIVLNLAVVVNLPFFHWSSLGASRVQIIAANLGLLCFVCAFAVRLYSARIRQVDGNPLPLSSLQSLMRVIALVAALPICAIVLAVIIPPTSSAFAIVFPISLIGVVVLLVAYLSMHLRRQAAD